MGAPGCDDAPVIKVPLLIEPKRITLLYPYYENPNFLQEQLDRWWSWPRSLATHVDLIVVDDGSPNRSAGSVLSNRALPLRTRCFRIEVDVRWNWLAARNIGAHHCATRWLAITDMDHVVPVETLRTLIHGEHSPGVIYRFSRREHDGKSIHPHPNSWFYTKEMFWKIGGYDERMSGYYGSDGYYRRRCAATAPIRIMQEQLERHERIGDSSTVRYLRKQPEDAKLRPMVRAFLPGSKPKTLSFPYHEVLL